MPRLVNQNPSYRRHKPSGQAIVSLNGEDVYLGTYGSKQSRREYDRVVGEWLARGRQRPCGGGNLRVADLIASYWRFAQNHYGTPERLARLSAIKRMLGILRRSYGTTPARAFGPLALQVVRQKMVEEGWSRPYVNAQVTRLKRVFKWGASQELVSASVFHGLQTVEGLRRDANQAPEPEPVKPIPEEWVEATINHVSREVEAMIRLQLATGMRPGEVCILRGCDLDTTGDVWTYEPQKHKTQHHGYQRIVYLGPKAKAIVEPFLKPDMQAYLFSPAEAEAERRAELHAARKTPLSCGNTIGTNCRRKPEKRAGDRYTVSSYRRAIANACDAAFPPSEALARVRVKSAKGIKRTRWESLQEWRARLGPEKWAELVKWQQDHRWHPHQLRHNAATRLRKQYGLEAARVVLGHRSAAVAEVYAEIDHTKAQQIMAEVG